MNTILNFFGVNTAYAATAKPSPVAGFVGRVNEFVLNPLIIMMFAVALLFFLYGVVEFIMNSDKSDERELGKNHIIWGVVGMFIMFSVYAILRMIENTFGITHNANIQ